jgi:hypothetical protein
MNKTLINSLKILFGFALTMQLAGCFYVGDDHRWHGGHREHQEFEGHHDAGVDVHLHG